MQYIVLLILLSLAANIQAANIYKSRDNRGTVLYSDKKPEGDYELFSKEKKKRLSDPDQSASEEESVILPEKRDLASIRTTTDSVKNNINEIYKNLFLDDNEVRGELKVDFTINQQGQVTNCTEDESQMQKAGFNGKACQTIQQLNYGAVQSVDPITVNFTYTFQPL